MFDCSLNILHNLKDTDQNLRNCTKDTVSTELFP